MGSVNGIALAPRVIFAIDAIRWTPPQSTIKWQLPAGS
jgi:hypothetical protein